MKGKTSVLSRSWANLPPTLLSSILNHLWFNTRTSLPRSWGADPRLWHSAMIYRALRDIGPIENLLLVCTAWLKALEHHPLWNHLIALLDPMDLVGAPPLSNGRHSSVTSRVSPYIHYSTIINSSCLICRINQPFTSQGVGHGRFPSAHGSGRTGGLINSTNFANFVDGIIPVCKYHRNDETFCCVCLREIPPPGQYRDDIHEQQVYALGIFSNEDNFAFPNASATCRSCRIAYLSLLTARHRALQVIGGANFLHQPALDWEPRSAIDSYIDAGEGTAESVLRLCKEKWWLRRETRLGEYVRLGVRSERLALFGEAGRRMDQDFAEDLLSDDDEDEDPTELSMIEDNGAREMAVRDWLRSQFLKGDWRDTWDTWQEASYIFRQQRKLVDPSRITHRYDSEVLKFDADFDWSSDYEEEVESFEDGSGWVDDDMAPYTPTPEEAETFHKITVKKPCWWAFAPPEEEVPSETDEPLPSQRVTDDDHTSSYSAERSEPLSHETFLEDDDEMDSDLKLALELSRMEHEREQTRVVEREGAPSPPPSRRANGHSPKRYALRNTSPTDTKPVRAPRRPTVTDDDGPVQLKTVALPPPTSPHFPSTQGIAEMLSRFYPSVVKDMLSQPLNRLVLALERIAKWRNSHHANVPPEGSHGEKVVDAGMLAARLSLDDIIGLLRDVDDFWFSSEGRSTDALRSTADSREAEWNGGAELDTIEREVEKVLWRWLPPSSSAVSPASDGGHAEQSSLADTKLVHPIPWIPTDLTSLGIRARAHLSSIWRHACAPLYHCKCRICDRARWTEKVAAQTRKQAEQQVRQAEAEYEESLRERFGVPDQRPPKPQQNPYPPDPPPSLYPAAPIDEKSKGRLGTIVIPPRVTTQVPLTPVDGPENATVTRYSIVSTDSKSGITEEEGEADGKSSPSTSPLSDDLHRQRKRCRDGEDEPCHTASSLPSPPSLQDEEGDTRDIKKLDVGMRVQGAMHLEEDHCDGNNERDRKRTSEELELYDDQGSEKRLRVG